MVANTEARTLSRLIEPDGGDLPPEVARFILGLDFKPDDINRMNELAEKARSGALGPDEEQEAEEYERVGNLLALIQSKARLSLET